MTLILAIESSCDETACAVVKDGKEILSNIPLITFTVTSIDLFTAFKEYSLISNVGVKSSPKILSIINSFETKFP